MSKGIDYDLIYSIFADILNRLILEATVEQEKEDEQSNNLCEMLDRHAGHNSPNKGV